MRLWRLSLRALSSRLAVLLALVFCGVNTGCKTMPVAGFTEFPRPFAKKKTKEPEIFEGSLDPGKGIPEYEAAMVTYDEYRRLLEENQLPAAQKKLVQALKEFKKVAKKFKKNPIEEDALFMVAECYYLQKNYSRAQDGYDKMFKEYPTTRHLEVATRRLFTIGTIWLSPDGSERSDTLMKVNAEEIIEQDKPVAKEKSGFSILPNLWDKTKPAFDTKGNALRALKSVWLHDPTGPLADDALMMTAAYHLRRGDYREADHIFGILREEYPKCDHANYAFVLGSHVKLASYQGPLYDGKVLNDSEDLIRSTINIYPDSPQRPKLEATLQRIKEQAAERDWAKAELWRKKRNWKSQALYCELVIKDHPDSSYAQKARDALAKLDPKYRNGLIPDYPAPPAPVKPREPYQPPGKVRVSDDGQ